VLDSGMVLLEVLELGGLVVEVAEVLVCALTSLDGVVDGFCAAGVWLVTGVPIAEGCSPLVVVAVLLVLPVMLPEVELGGVVWLLVVAEGEGETAV